MAYFHVWFATKRRRWLLHGDLLEETRTILRKLAKERDIRLLESEAVVDHVHLLLELPDAQALPTTMKTLKGVSARRIFLKFPELKLDTGLKSFWQEGYGSRQLQAGELPQIKDYIRTQWDRLDNYESVSKRRTSSPAYTSRSHR